MESLHDILVDAAPQIFIQEYHGDERGEYQKRYEIAPGKAHLFHLGALGACLVTARVQRVGKFVRLAECAYKYGDYHGQHRLYPLEDIAAFHVRAARLLRHHYLIRFLDKSGDKAQCDGHYKRYVAHGNFYQIERLEQTFYGVGEFARTRGKRQNGGAHDEQDKPEHHLQGKVDCLGRYGEYPPRPLHARISRIEEQVEYSRYNKQNYYALYAFEHRLGRHVGDGADREQKAQHERIAEVGRHEKHGHDIKHREYDFQSGVEPVHG